MTEKNINIVQSKNNKYSNAAAEFFATVGAVLSCAAFLLLFGEGFASVKNYVIIAVGAYLCGRARAQKNRTVYCAWFYSAEHYTRADAQRNDEKRNVPYG